MGLLCNYSTLLKLYSRCRAPLPTIPASLTAPAALLPPTYRPLSTTKLASAASLSLARHCLTTASILNYGAALGTRQITLKMAGMASGTIPVFRVKSLRVSTSLKIGETSVAGNPLISASSKVAIRVLGVSYTRPTFHDSIPCLKEYLLIGELHQG